MDGGNVTDLRDESGSLDPDRIAHDIAEKGEIWARLDDASRLLERTRDTVLARLILDIKDREKCSMRQAELLAKASNDWENHVYAATEAKLKANLARVQFDAAKARFEAMRSAEASRRAEMTTFGRR